MVVGCVQHYSTHYIRKIGKSLEPFFHKVQKTAKKGDFSKISNMYKKKGHAIFEPLRCRNFIPSFRKILERFLSKALMDERTNERT